jgi:hypothetical protein
MEIALAEDEIIYAPPPAEKILYTPVKRCDACGEVFCTADCPYWKKMQRKKDMSQTERQNAYSDKYQTSSVSKPQASSQAPAQQAMRQTASIGKTSSVERNNKRRMVHH